ncbi:MAG: glutaredoxin family protein [Pseudomonadota bacterium]
MKLAITPRAVGAAGLGLALLLCATSASAQMYRWVDASGKTHFTSSPPPPTARSVNQRAVGQGSTVALPYALALAVRNAPVVLFTTEGCAGCEMGRSLLKKRGVPFTEKTVSTGNDDAKMKEAGGNGQLPFITIGPKRLTGFESSAWDNALTAAAYPVQKMLPSNFVYAAPVPASPPPTQVAAVAPPPPRIVEQPRKQPEEERTAPPGFQF